MHNRVHTDESWPNRLTSDRLLWCALVPLFAIVEGAHRVTAGRKHEEAVSDRRNWLTEAKTQASIATSYARMARALMR